MATDSSVVEERATRHVRARVLFQADSPTIFHAGHVAGKGAIGRPEPSSQACANGTARIGAVVSEVGAENLERYLSESALLGMELISLGQL